VTFVPQQASTAVGGVGCHVPGTPAALAQGTNWLLLQVMTGGIVSVMVIVCVQNETLPQQSLAIQVTTMVSKQGPLTFVTAPMKRTNTDAAGQQLSVAVGGVNVHVLPHWNVRLLAHAMTGGTLSTIVTVWLQFVALPQQSVSDHVRVTTTGHWPGVLVKVLVTAMVTGLVQQSSIAVGGLNVSAVPQLIVLFVGQIATGGCVSTMLSVWMQGGDVFVQQSVAVHVSTKLLKHGVLTFVTTLTRLTVTFVPQQKSITVGRSPNQLVLDPHSICLNGGQFKIGGFVSTMLTTSVQNAELVQQSVARQVRVIC
jgi:hypothetical protein